MDLKKIAAGLLVGLTALVIASPASALTTSISVTGSTIGVSCTDNVAPINDPVCMGIVGGSLTKVGNDVVGGTSGSLSGSLADLYDIGNSSNANEAAALNVLTGTTSFVGSDGSQTDAGGVASLTFDSDASVIAFALGGGQLPGRYFFLNLISPGTITIEFDQNGQTSGGFSHYTEFGRVSAVPVPAAVWLFGTALIGFIGMARRTKV